MTDDRHDFEGGAHRDVHVDGFDLAHRDGSPIYVSDEGPVDERVFFFRVAGVGHHKGGAQSPAFAPMSQVLLVRERTNEVDPNVIRVLGRDRSMAGYVPASLAAVFAPMIDGIGQSAAVGVVTKTYSVQTGRNASRIEVLATLERDMQITASIEEGHQYDAKIR